MADRIVDRLEASGYVVMQGSGRGTGSGNEGRGCGHGSYAARRLRGCGKPTPEALTHDHGARAYAEARERERDVIVTDGTTHAGRTPAHWRRVALIVPRMTGKRVGVDTATRMAEDAKRQG